jgi:hypothetical protein
VEGEGFIAPVVSGEHTFTGETTIFGGAKLGLNSARSVASCRRASTSSQAQVGSRTGASGICDRERVRGSGVG